MLTIHIHTHLLHNPPLSPSPHMSPRALVNPSYHPGFNPYQFKDTNDDATNSNGEIAVMDHVYLSWSPNQRIV